jgi:hypothetical protein
LVYAAFGQSTWHIYYTSSQLFFRSSLWQLEQIRNILQKPFIGYVLWPTSVPIHLKSTVVIFWLPTNYDRSNCKKILIAWTSYLEKPLMLESVFKYAQNTHHENYVFLVLAIHVLSFCNLCFFSVQIHQCVWYCFSTVIRALHSYCTSG